VAEDFAATLADPDEGTLDTRAEMDFMPRSRMVEPPEERAPVSRDTTFIRHGLTFTIDITFYDVNDIPSEEYDSLTTVRMTRLMTITGSHEGPMRQATLNHESFLERNHIAPEDEIHIINGNATSTVTSHFDAIWRNVTRDFQAQHSWTREDIQIHTDRELHPYPLSGTITGHTVITRTIVRNNRNVTETVEVGFTMTFDGTRYARMEMDDGTVFWIDLDTGIAYRERPGEP